MKEVLSANQEYPVKAEQLHADVDLITKVTRVDFEEACSVSKHFKPFFILRIFLLLLYYSYWKLRLIVHRVFIYCFNVRTYSLD